MRLINDILDLSKIESGKLEMIPVDFAMDELIHSVRGTVVPLVMSKGLELKIEITPNLPQMHTDDNKLKQILLNLLSNAVKFTEAGFCDGAGAVPGVCKAVSFEVLPRTPGSPSM